MDGARSRNPEAMSSKFLIVAILVLAMTVLL